MRQGQNQKRSRGRGRKPQNPLSRSMESNGPDVKIRGTASHIYEKYQALARDAQSSGDRIASESYFQHAEHYHRLIVAAQAQQEQNRQESQNRQENQGRDGRGGNGRANGEETSTEDQPAAEAAEKPAPEEAAAESEAADGDVDEKPAPRRRAPRRRRAPAKAKSDSGSDGGDDKPASEDVPA